MNLETKQLTQGEYMQGVQMQVQRLSPILKHVNELLLLPETMKWGGEASFELTALSEIENHKIVIRKFLSLRIRVSAETRSVLSAVVEEAKECLKGWLLSVSANYQEVCCDDDGAFIRMPPCGYTFLVKKSRRAVGGYTAAIMPLDEHFSADLSNIEALLCKYPFSGILFQLSPDRWNVNEIEVLQRFAVGEHVPDGEVQDVLGNGIACFNCAVWGDGSRALSNAIMAESMGTLAVKRVRTNGHMVAELLACDPWYMHSKIHSASRYAGILTAKELNRVFQCKLIQAGQTKEDVLAGQSGERMLLELLHDSVKRVASDMIADSERRTTEQLQQLSQDLIGRSERLERDMIDCSESAKRKEAEIRSDFREEIQASEKATREKIDQAAKATRALKDQLVNVDAGMNSLREDYERISKAVEKSMLVTENEKDELLSVLQYMAIERNELKKELLFHIAHDPEQPLSKNACKLLEIESEEALVKAGMPERQVKVLRIAMSCIEGKEIMESEVASEMDATYYHPYITFFGFLYEQMVRGFYHDKIYVPYCNRYCGGILMDPGKSQASPDLSCYENGPISRGMQCYSDSQRIIANEWQRWKVVQRFSDGISIANERYEEDFWREMLNMMKQARSIRNMIHDAQMSTKDAYAMINVMVRNHRSENGKYPCLVRWLTSLSQATTDFENVL